MTVFMSFSWLQDRPAQRNTKRYFHAVHLEGPLWDLCTPMSFLLSHHLRTSLEISGHLVESSEPLFHRLHVKNSPLSHILWWALKIQTSPIVWALSGDSGSKESCGFMLFLIFRVMAASCKTQLPHTLLSPPSSFQSVLSVKFEGEVPFKVQNRKQNCF